MKLEHCKIEQFDGEALIELGFSVPFGVSAELVTEIGRRIEHFLMPLHAPASEPAVPANMPEAEVVTAGVATVVAPAKRTRTPKAETPEPTEPLIEEEIIPAPAPRRTRAPAPVAVPEITDMDLAKAASGAAEVLGTQIVKDIIAEMGVKTVNEIEGFEKRQYFLGLLDAEKKLAEEEKADG